MSAQPSPLLPPGRIPAVGVRELVATLHRRRARRREAAAELREALDHLVRALEQHAARVAALREAVEAQGGDLQALRYYDTFMARLRCELRSAERALAEAFRSAAKGGGEATA